MKILIFSLPTILLIIGLVLIIPAVVGMFRCISAQSWPCTKGIVTQLKIERQTHSSKIKRESVSEEVKVKYDYSVDGIQYSGDKIAFAYFATDDAHEHSDIKNRLSELKSVKVFYNPKNPAQAVLTTRISAHHINRGLGGLVWLGVGFFFLFAMLLDYNSVFETIKVIKEKPEIK
jgi:uncharacterized protein YxeA